MQKADKGEKPPSETRNCYVENNQSGTVAPVWEAFREVILFLLVHRLATNLVVYCRLHLHLPTMPKKTKKKKPRGQTWTFQSPFFCFSYLFTRRGQIRGSVLAVLSLPVFPALHAGLKQAPQTAQPEALTVRRKFQRQSHKDPLILVLIIIICSALHIVKMMVLFGGRHLCLASAYFEGLKLILSNIVERL